ncbi:MAG: dihydroorotate dehydrogenase (quinone) [SAR86 cluster bacterium]|uniref:Dihydroorotate dehydrogenase (quinone) n=1 Tax=SAR86 cluster bacterium TaxID=2030880 RepID=A0A2A4WU39_9GAMM|nr:MAG: dihydroorotate dehydrogenase (quinone) [SAR86 cluster bacterium]
MYKLLRNILFCLPAEASHNLALRAMKIGDGLGASALLAANTAGKAAPTRVMGIDFPHVVGLAAGLDKNADYVDALASMGFGFIEVGTLTPRPQPGNPKPRMFRLKSEQAIINRLGFNNKGIEYACEKISKLRNRGVLGINIGKNFDTPVEQANQDYIHCLRRAYQLADYITVNISSPNTPGLRNLQFGDELNSLLDDLKEEQARLQVQHKIYTPISVKLAPDMTEEQIASCCESLLSRELDGVIATNTTLDKSSVAAHAYAEEAGGLSGAPLSEKSCEVLKCIKAEVGERMPIIGVGGIMSADLAQQRLEAGADLLQIYTGFIYQGPPLIEQILAGIASD